MIISTGVPLTFFDNIWVQRSYKCLTPSLRLPSASTVATRVRKRNKTTIDDLKAILKDKKSEDSRVSLAFDCWSSKGFRHSFIAIKGHWIDRDWNLHDELLGFRRVEGTHTGKNLAGYVEEILEEFDLHKRISAFTADNASNNRTLYEQV